MHKTDEKIGGNSPSPSSLRDNHSYCSRITVRTVILKDLKLLSSYYHNAHIFIVKLKKIFGGDAPSPVLRREATPLLNTSHSRRTETSCCNFRCFLAKRNNKIVGAKCWTNVDQFLMIYMEAQNKRMAKYACTETYFSLALVQSPHRAPRRCPCFTEQLLVRDR